MLARTYGPKFNRYPCFVQPKLNGLRALYQGGVLQSRGEKLWAPPFFTHIREELETLNLGNTMLDGELYKHGWRLQRINAAMGVNNNAPNQDTPNVEFHVFDCLDERGLACPFFERWPRVFNLLDQAKLRFVKPVETDLADSPEMVKNLFDYYVGQGYEGSMLRPDGPYELGVTTHGTTYRSPSLWKYKSWKDGEYLCVGVTQGEGKASIGIGALVLSVNGKDQLRREWSVTDILDFAQKQGGLFHCGTGFSDEDRIALALNPPIGRMIRVRYVEKTADGIPYPCRFEAVMFG